MTSTVTTSVNVNSTPAAYVMSHSTFNFGQKLSRPNITPQTLLLSELSNSTVQIEFLYIDIGCTNNYNNDTGYIQSLVGTEPSFTFTCYNLTSDIPATFRSATDLSNYVGFSFNISNHVRRGGFLLKYSGQ